MYRPLARLSLALLIMFALAVLPVTTLSARRAQAPLKVVATFSIVADMVQNIGGDNVQVEVLVGPGLDSHTYEPVPADSAKLADAALIFEVGLEFESWLDELYVASGSQALRVPLSENIDLLEFEEGHDDHEGEKAEATAEATGEADADHDDDHDDDHGDEHGEFDPHVWHDADRAIVMVTNITTALTTADPANAAVYAENFARYSAQLGELTTFAETETAKVPEARRVLFTTHDTFQYFGQRYGYTVDSALGATTEAADPAAGEIAELVEEIRASGVPAIFVDNVTNPRLMEQIAGEAGVQIAPTLYTDALGEPGSEGDTYLKMFRYNVTTIVNALSQ